MNLFSVYMTDKLLKTYSLFPRIFRQSFVELPSDGCQPEEGRREQRQYVLTVLHLADGIIGAARHANGGGVAGVPTL